VTKCAKCGGTIHKTKCLLCELFTVGATFTRVETMRANNPQPSLSMKVHPEQIPEAIEHARQHGVPTNFTPDGCPLIESRQHQKAYAKTRGFFNRDDV
jgi:hypothetical protein